MTNTVTNKSPGSNAPLMTSVEPYQNVAESMKQKTILDTPHEHPINKPFLIPKRLARPKFWEYLFETLLNL